MRTAATFRLFGNDALTVQAVTDRLGIVPSGTSATGWLLSSGPDEGVELSIQIDRLLVQLEPHETTLWQLVEQGYRANWLCYVASNAPEHAAELGRDLLARLLLLPGDLWIDACGEKVAST